MGDLSNNIVLKECVNLQQLTMLIVCIKFHKKDYLINNIKDSILH